MKKFWFALLISVLDPTFSCAQDQIDVVATNSIVGDWVKNVAGDQVNLTVLVGPNSDVHTFEPTPSDNVVLSKAKVIFEIGFGLEHWMDKLYTASSSKAKRIHLARTVVYQPLSMAKGGIGSHEEDADPHVWHNVRYVIGMVKQINQTLKSFDPIHADLYDINTTNYLNQLQELDTWVTKVVSQIPKDKRKLVTNHDSLGYFCERYQIELIGAVFDSYTTEAEDPSAKVMAELIFKIRQSGVHAVFSENSNHSKALDALAREAHLNKASALYTDALGIPGSPADTYIKMMRYNTETIVKALQE